MKLNRAALIRHSLQRSIDHHINEMEAELMSIPLRCEVNCPVEYVALEEDRIWRACHRAYWHYQHGIDLNKILEDWI